MFSIFCAIGLLVIVMAPSMPQSASAQSSKWGYLCVCNGGDCEGPPTCPYGGGNIPRVTCDYAQHQDPYLRNFRRSACQGMGLHSSDDDNDLATVSQVQDGQCGKTVYRYRCE